jgi:hypothetical protein
METLLRKNTLETDLQPKTKELRERIIQANGRPILLKASPYPNRSLYLMVSSLEYEPIERNKKDGRNWRDSFKGVPTSRCMVLTSVFVEKTNGEGKKNLSPIGFNNSQIVNGCEVVGGYSKILPPVQIKRILDKEGEILQKSYDYWKDKYRFCFYLDSHYQKHDIGSFMLIASMTVLNLRGGKTLGFSQFLEPSIKTFGKFGEVSGNISVDKEGKPIMVVKSGSIIIRNITDNPYAERVISKFI